jgi:hypothetical protein
MTTSWMWIAIIFVLVLPSVGYGWGYRGWGAPYPRYIQRRRGRAATVIGDARAFDHHAWGWFGDFVWGMIAIGLVWTCYSLWRQ